MKCQMPTSKDKKAVLKKVPLTIIGNANTAVDTADTNSENIDYWKYKIFNMANIFNESQDDPVQWDNVTFYKINDSLHNICSDLKNQLDKITDPMVTLTHLKNSVNNAAIESFSTRKQLSKTIKHHDMEYFDSSKFTDDNIKAFCDKVNNTIASYNIVLTALKLARVSSPKDRDKITEHLCPQLSEMGHEYLNKNIKNIVTGVCKGLNDNRTFWSKLWNNDFKVSSTNLHHILDETTNSCEGKENNEAKLYSSLPILDYNDPNTCNDAVPISRFNKLYRSFSPPKITNCKSHHPSISSPILKASSVEFSEWNKFNLLNVSSNAEPVLDVWEDLPVLVGDHSKIPDHI
ncbi:hypothetical protein [Candidatus Tisiphia endosymbiont of Ceraclea dissimilis]|uniref:hypothetical protein n=1 Tax=Candidatus Tisiphia endosymbiont of Ceraclea dissimilis TaxID=3077928 RepID=UPI003CCAC2D4